MYRFINAGNTTQYSVLSPLQPLHQYQQQQQQQQQPVVQMLQEMPYNGPVEMPYNGPRYDENRVRSQRIYRQNNHTSDSFRRSTNNSTYGSSRNLKGENNRMKKTIEALRGDINVSIVKIGLKKYGFLFADIERVKKEKDILEKSLSNVEKCIMGPTQNNLENVFSSIGAHRQTYYTRNFNGNHMHIILKPDNIEKIIQVFPVHDNMTSSLKKIMLNLSEILSCTAARTLDVCEIQNLENNVREMIVEMKQIYPNQTVTPKLHMLVHHVPEHIRMFGTWGKTSEQGIESLHAVINSLNRTCCAIRDKVCKSRAIVQKLCFMNHTFDSDIFDS